MTATIILGILIAALLALGLRNIYSNFFKGTSTCCSEGGCPGCGAREGAPEGGSYRERVERIASYEMKRSIDVEGMTCERCTASVIRALEQIDGVAVAAASLEKRAAHAALEREVPNETLADAIRKAGYRPGACVAL